jgi:hypothetical protein
VMQAVPSKRATLVEVEPGLMVRTMVGISSLGL